MKKLITLFAIAILSSCSQEETTTTFCKTINSKESIFEWDNGNTYTTHYYFVLDGVKTRVTKLEFENNNVGGQLCKTLDY